MVLLRTSPEIMWQCTFSKCSISHRTIICPFFFHSEFTKFDTVLAVGEDVGEITCQVIWDKAMNFTFNPAECSAVKTVTASLDDPCGCQMVSTGGFCSARPIDRDEPCDMCQGNGPLTNPSALITGGSWDNFACQTVFEVQAAIEFTEDQCSDAKKAASEVCGCGDIDPSPPVDQEGPPVDQEGPQFCFSGQTEVVVKDQGEVLMKNLRLGDEVLVSADKYERVYSFGHRHESVKTDYLQLYSASSSAPLEITNEHMVIVEDGRAVPASTVQIGDKIQAVDAVVVVTAIKAVTRLGAFAPFTPSGTVVVNNVVASSFVAFQETDVLTIGSIKTPLSFQWLAHTFETPHRLYCSISDCLTEEYTSEGVSKWVSAPLAAMSWWFAQNTIVMSLLLLPVLAVFLCLSALANAGNAAALILLGTAVWRRRQSARKM